MYQLFVNYYQLFVIDNITMKIGIPRQHTIIFLFSGTLYSERNLKILG